MSDASTTIVVASAVLAAGLAATVAPQPAGAQAPVLDCSENTGLQYEISEHMVPLTDAAGRHEGCLLLDCYGQGSFDSGPSYTYRCTF